MKKSHIIIAILILLFKFASAQLGIKESWNNAEYIFEGQIIKIEAYQHPLDKDVVYTSNIIKINRVFKGNLKPGEVIDLVTYGGLLYYPDGSLYTRYNPEAEFMNKTKGVFFCTTPRAGYILENPKTSQYLRLVLFDRGESIRGYDQDRQDPFDPGISSKYATRGDFYNNYLKKFKGVIIPEKGFDPEFDKNIFENIQKTETPVLKSSPVPQEPIDTLAMYKRTEEHLRLTKLRFDSIRSANRSKKKIIQLKATAADVLARFTLANAQLSATSATARYFEFDVCMQANTAGTYLNEAQFVLQFNTSAFGSSLFASSAIDVKPAGCFATNYSFTYQGDKATNQVILHLYVKNAMAGFTREEVPSYAQKAEPVVHVKIKIKTCGKSSALELVDVSNTCASYTSAADKQVPSPTLIDYSGYDITSKLSKNTCEVIIDDLSPKQITAGTHDGTDTIVIKGSGFGVTRVAPYIVNGAIPKGEVLFKNADSANCYLPYLDSIDYISWADNEIHLRVPSIVRWYNKTTAKWVETTPGSSFFRVRNYMKDSTVSVSPNYLDIVYSCMNAPEWDNSGTTLRKYRTNIANWNNAASSDIKFVVGKNVARNKDALQCIEKALAAWSCEISINLLLERDSLGKPLTSSKAKARDPELRNVIYINEDETVMPSYTKGGLMQAIQIPRFCGALYARTAYGVHPVIAIANLDSSGNTSGSRWFYDATGTKALTPGYYDFYSALLHELGHILMLNHVIDLNKELMFWTQGPGLSVTDRLNLKSSRTYNGSYPSLMGVRNIISASKIAVYDNCGDAVGPLKESAVKICGVQVIPNIQTPTLYQSQTFNLPYYVTGAFNVGNVFTVQLSDASGSFGTLTQTSALARTKATQVTAAAPTVIGSLAATGSGTISCTIPASVPVGSGYKIRIVASSPATTGAPSSITLSVIPAGATINTGNITQTPICTGKQVSVPYTFSNLTFNTGNVFTAQLSDAQGSFANPVNIGTLTSATAGSITTTIPTNTVGGQGYRIRVVSSNPQLTAADNGANLSIGVTPGKPTITMDGPTDLCEGGYLTLTASSAGGYLWSPGGETTQSITISSSNTYSVVVSNNGCTSSSNSITYTFVPRQSLSVSISCSPSNQLCPDGSSVTFSAQPTIKSDFIDYKWKLNGNNIGTNSPTFTTSSLKAGNDIQCVITALTGCFLTNPVNSNTITMENAVNVYPSLEINATPRFADYSDPRYENIQWTNQNDHCSADGTSIEATNKLTGVRGYADIVQQISEGGNLYATIPAISVHMRIYLGFGNSAFDYYFKLEEDNGHGVLYAIEPSNSYRITSNYTTGAALRLAIIHGKVCFFYKDELKYVSNNSILTPANLKAEIYFGTAIDGTYRIEHMQLRKSSTTFIFNAIAKNAGSNPTYQWKYDSVLVGSNNSEYAHMNFQNSGLVSCQVTSSDYCNKTATATYEMFKGRTYPNDYIYDVSFPFFTPYSFQSCRNVDILANINADSSQILNFYASNEINIGNGTDSDFEIGPDVNFEILPCTTQSNVMSSLSQERNSLTITNIEDENSAITIFPNPASGKVFFQFHQNEETKNNIAVFSLTGVKLFETGYFTITNGVKAIDISGLTSAVYILNIETNGEVIKRKVMVK